MNVAGMWTGSPRRAAAGGLLTDVAALPPRLALGGAMLYHGASKLRGEGPAQTGQFFEAVGIKPGEALARATGWAEVLAGALSLLGVGTRIAALTVLATQLVAVNKVHAPKGFDIMKGGYEYNAALIAIALALLLRGPGKLSVHEGLEHLAEGHGARRWLRRARPSPLLRALKLVK
jgi:putative oxidoreductase